MIHVQQLTKVYEDLQRGRLGAVDRVSFTVRPGEIFGLLGPNGAGKTTVLRILSTVLSPTSGIATVAGFDVEHDAAEVRRNIGFVSNNTAIYDRMTAWEMVEYFGRLHGMSPDTLTDRLEKLFDQLRMNDFRDVPGGKMSTGMKQKVSIARAMVHDPPVLVFDEATLGLDVLVARNLLSVIRSLREAGKCLIFSTHIMSEVERLCDRIAIMYRGQILDSGTLEELSERHKEDDFEELFFGLLSRHESDEDLVAPSKTEEQRGEKEQHGEALAAEGAAG
ncbi:MAG: ATP-binding cassette domain-containing protein [Planctomycetota bacterium]